MEQMRRKVVLVTGGARGLGRALVADFATDHDVICHYNTTYPHDLPASVHAIQADLTKTDAAERLISEGIDRFGAIDVIINNAGRADNTPIEGFNSAQANALFNVNVIASAALLSAALPYLSAGSSIVSLSSVNAVLPASGASLYGASKAAVEHWTRAMAKELGPKGIRVNALAPGAINLPDAPRTDETNAWFANETALGRVATPEDITQVVRFLTSDAAGFITGECVAVSGGYRL